MAVSHWGDNTVALIDIQSSRPRDWKYTDLFVIDQKLDLNFGLDVQVDRDDDSGWCLRGTVFTPDDRYLLVGCMGKGGGIAVIDMQQRQYLGRVQGMRANVRHLVIRDGWLYLSINRTGYVQRIRLDRFLSVAKAMKNRLATVSGWQECKVGVGARTIELSPDGRYVFAACNIDSRLDIVDTRTMQLVLSVPADSYTVGLDISADGRTVITTSQGRGTRGGNCVDIYHIDYR
jgi:DNA-binding beta-propeller fold protein YncE